MPRKSKKSTEPEAVARTASETHESDQPQPTATAIPAGESDLPKKKSAPKKRAKKSASATSGEPALDLAAADLIPPAASQAANAELSAHAADTFEDAFESNDAHETHSAESAAEPGVELTAETVPPKKPAKRKPAKARASQPAPEQVPEPEPDEDADLGPDEDDELEGDWESGSGPGDENEREKRQAAPLPPPMLERLQKIIAAAGIASRRHAEELITEGRVQVNGKVVTELGSKADAARDHIRVDGKLLHGAERLRYFVLNKPRGFVTTVSDPEGRATVMDFFSKMSERIYPVGRLDYLSEGLLLMTNDGELANKLTRAASGVEKTYLVKVSGQPDEGSLDALREGVVIAKGRVAQDRAAGPPSHSAGERVRTAPARIQLVRAGDNPWFEVTLIEGRNRELRKMFEEIGHHVEKIRRVGYGPLILDLEPGQLRELDAEELRLLRLAAEGKWKPKRVKFATMLPKEAGRSVEHEADKRRGGKPFRQDRRPGQPFQPRDARPDRGRGGERPAFGRTQRPEQGSAPIRNENRGPAQGDRRPPARGGFERPRPQGGGFGRSAEGSREVRGFAARGGDLGKGRQDRGFAPRDQDRGQDRGQGRWQSRGPQRDQIRPPSSGGGSGARQGFGAQDRGPRREAGAGFGNQDRGRDAQRTPREGGGQRGGFSRPQGQRPQGTRPFRPKPEFGTERPRFDRPLSDARPPRPSPIRIEEEGRDFKAGTERPAGAGRSEQRFGNRPPRTSGGGFRPDRGGEGGRGGSRGPGRSSGGGPGRGPSRGPAGGQGRGQTGGASRGFNQRSGGRPPRVEGGAPRSSAPRSSAPRSGGSGSGAPRSGASRSGPPRSGGRPGFGGNHRKPGGRPPSGGKPRGGGSPRSK
jgi:23S rRNA pseudouridine2605 synthase